MEDRTNPPTHWKGIFRQRLCEVGDAFERNTEALNHATPEQQQSQGLNQARTAAIELMYKVRIQLRDEWGIAAQRDPRAKEALPELDRLLSKNPLVDDNLKAIINLLDAISTTEPAVGKALDGSKGGRPPAVHEVDGEKIRQLRDKIPQKIFAHFVGISIATFQRAESGSATSETLRKICGHHNAKDKGIKPDDFKKPAQTSKTSF